MKYVIGIDAGGTYFRIKAKYIEGTGNKECSFPSLGYYSQNKHVFLKELDNIIKTCITDFGELSECISIVAGVSGIDSEDDRVSLENDIKLITHCKKVLCLNDAELANEGINEGIGILLNSGTGSIVYGTNAQGYKCRVGGWPLFIFGDEGSGAWVALKTLRLYAAWIDGLVPKTCLIEMLQELFSLNTTKDFMDLVLSLDPATSAKIPPIVDEAETKGDENARKILNEAALASFNMVKEIAQKLGYTNKDSFNVGVWGSNILNSNRHFSKFQEYIKKEFPKALIRVKKESLLEFAVNTALKMV